MPDPTPLAPPAPSPFLPHMVGTVPRAFSQARPVRMPTLMVVEDSRYACEVMRLYARALGLRLRRAADLESAASHLRLYRPDIALVDLGLPDGRGEALIAQLARAIPRVPLLLATSGQSDLAAGALAAGADLFIEKPFPDISDFRALLVDHFPGPLPLLLLPPRPASTQPDRIALQDDLDVAAKTLSLAQDSLDQDPRFAAARTRYAAGLLDGVARSMGDGELQRAARREWQANQGPLEDFSNASEGSTSMTPAIAPQPEPAHSADARAQAEGSAQGENGGFRKLRDLVNERLRDVSAERGL